MIESRGSRTPFGAIATSPSLPLRGCGRIPAVKLAAKTGLELDVSQVACYATYRAEPLMLVDVAANLPGKRPDIDVGSSEGTLRANAGLLDVGDHDAGSSAGSDLPFPHWSPDNALGPVVAFRGRFLRRTSILQ